MCIRDRSTAVTYFIAQLQVLAAASHAAASSGPPAFGAHAAARSEPLEQLAEERSLSGQPAHGAGFGGDVDGGSAPAPSDAAAPSSSSLEEMPAGGPPDMWVPPEAVMSTEQVLSLIDCLGDKAPPGAGGGAPRQLSRKGSGLALDALARFSPEQAEPTALHRLTPPPPALNLL